MNRFRVLLLFFLSAAASGGEPLTLQLRWYHQFQFAGYYAARDQGYFRDEGIDIELLEGVPGTSLVESALAKPGRIGIGNSALVLEFATGNPIVILEPIFQHAADVLISLESRGIRTPADLVGKNVMVRSFTGQPYPGFRGMMIREGIDTKKTQWSANSWNIDDLINGKGDAMSGYLTTQVPAFRKRGVPIRVLNPLDYGIDLYGDVLFTSKETAEKSPALLRRFMRATTRGWLYAFEHQSEMIDRILEFPTQRPTKLERELLETEAKEMRRLIEPDLVPIGYINPLRWERIIDLYKTLGELPADFSAHGLFFPDEAHEHELFNSRVRLGATALGILAALAGLWILQLRRQVARKTRALRTAVEKAREQTTIAEHSNEVKSLFLANMSHEIRTPLSAILGFSELLKDEGLSREDRLHYLAIIERTGQGLATILSDILDLSKIEAEKVDARFGPISLSALITDVEAILIPSAKKKNLQLTFESSTELPETFGTDLVRLKQILFNVIGNSLKFTENGSVDVRVSYEAPYLDFAVTDTGLGIDESKQKLLFQAFSQVDSSVRRSYGGTGLGLSLSRKLARILGGDVTLEKSRLGHGSTFRIRVVNSETTPISPPSLSAPSAVRIDGVRILVVDDCPDNQALVKLFIEKAGGITQVANDGEEALHILSENKFDIVLMDVQMPVMDGYTATQLLRKRGYKGPILALSANAMSEDRSRGMEAGFTDYLTKPVKKNDLIEAIANLIRS